MSPAYGRRAMAGLFWRGHDLLPSSGLASVEAWAEVLDGRLVVRVAAFRPDLRAASVLLGASCGGAFWHVLGPDWRWRSFAASPRGLLAVPLSPDLLPGEAFHLVAEIIDRSFARSAGPAGPDPLSPEEAGLIASLPGVLRGMHSALLVMLS